MGTEPTEINGMEEGKVWTGGRNRWTNALAGELVPTYPAINVSSLIFGSHRMWLH